MQFQKMAKNIEKTKYKSHMNFFEIIFESTSKQNDRNTKKKWDKRDRDKKHCISFTEKIFLHLHVKKLDKNDKKPGSVVAIFAI